MHDTALHLLSSLLDIPVSREPLDVLVSKDVRKIAVGGLSLSIPYEIVSSLLQPGLAVAILHVGGKESSLYLLMAAHLGGVEERGRAFMLDARGVGGIGFDDWLERSRATNLSEVLAELKALPKGTVKKNWIWSEKATRWNAGPPPVVSLDPLVEVKIVEIGSAIEGPA